MGSRPSVEEVFREYMGRRSGVIRALTTDVEEFFARCDPEKDNLCLCGHSDGTWEVNFPPEDVPPEIPEPTLGINFARDDMPRSDWLLMVAFHSDAWLISVAFYLGSHFDGSDRERLFTLINGLPTVHEFLSEQLEIDLDGGNESEHSMVSAGNNSDEGDHGGCRRCSGKNSDVFWIMCNTCDKWYHGKCVRVTPSQAKNIEKYKCPYCRCKRQQFKKAH